MTVSPGRGPLAKRRWAAFGHRHPSVRALALLSPPVGAFAFFYLAALAVLFVSAFWTVDSFTGQLVHHWTTGNFSKLWHGSTYRTVTLRTIYIAAAVTVTDAVIAFPFAYFMARLASPRTRAAVRARAAAALGVVPGAGLRVAADPQLGRPAQLVAAQARAAVGGDRVLEHGDVDRLLVHLAAVHDPAGLRGARADPHSYIEASRDLGAKGFRTLRTVILPLALPGVVAGSIFTFSLTLGDYITPVLVGGTSSQFIGNVVYDSVNQSSNLPFGAAFAVVPVVVMGAYLLIARRLGAFDAL